MPHTLNALLTPDTMIWSVPATSRKHALTLLSERLSIRSGIVCQEILENVMAREKLGSTGVGDGVAIPHARIDGISAPMGALARLRDAVDFEAVDDRPCDLVFMLIAPLASGADHLRALAQVARAFRQADLRDRLRAAATADDAYTILCPEARGAAA